MHLNIQSIKHKLDILEVEAQPYDILIFTETWLKPDTLNAELCIPNFNPPYRCDRLVKIGGGVAIYVRNSLLSKRRSDLDLNGIESVWIEVNTHQRKLLIGGIYRPPDSNQCSMDVNGREH